MCKSGEPAPPIVPVGVGILPSYRVGLPAASSMEGVRPPQHIQDKSLPASQMPEQKRRKETARLRSQGRKDPVEKMEDELGVVDAAAVVSVRDRIEVAPSLVPPCGSSSVGGPWWGSL